jgi:hypothetical protein
VERSFGVRGEIVGICSWKWVVEKSVEKSGEGDLGGLVRVYLGDLYRRAPGREKCGCLGGLQRIRG